MIEISIKCEKCERELFECDHRVYCEDCDCNVDHLKDALLDTAERTYVWEERETVERFGSEAEEAAFLKGVKYGYFHALFWMSHYFGLIDFYEVTISPYEREEGTK